MQRELNDDLINPPKQQQGCVVLPLTVTRRCGKAIVEEAKKIVPDFGAFDSNPEGVVRRAQYPTQKNESGTMELPTDKTYLGEIKGGDMAVCRVNAPLVRQCFKLIKMGVKATIQGRDVAKGLIALVTKMKAANIEDLIGKLSDWLAKELAKEGAARNPSETRMQSLEDRHDCVLCFTDGTSDVAEVVRRIESIFTDDKNAPGVRFSSIHKAKGLEAHRVYFLKPAVLPPFGGNRPKPSWVIEQEANLEYVAITRAIEELIFVV
jgi:DNA helicase II / ATP-dependent DNA helicase PcrA